jgi:hypothetical protein
MRRSQYDGPDSTTTPERKAANAMQLARMEAFIDTLFSDPNMLRMGHDQRLSDRNLGLGWLYYALGRVLRCNLAVVIGFLSWLHCKAIIAKALRDNVEEWGTGIHRSLVVDDFWADPRRVAQHFARGDAQRRHFARRRRSS